MEISVLIATVVILSGGLGILIGKMCAYQDTDPDDKIFQFQVNGETRREIRRPPLHEIDPGTLRIYARVTNELVVDPPVRAVI